METELELKNQNFERPSVIYFSFTIEEQNVLKDLISKFELPWLQNLLIADNHINHVYGSGNLKTETWDAFKISIGNNFRNVVLPRFSELEDLDPQDVGQLMNSPASGITHYFRSSQAFASGQYRTIGYPNSFFSRLTDKNFVCLPCNICSSQFVICRL